MPPDCAVYCALYMQYTAYVKTAGLFSFDRMPDNSLHLFRGTLSRIRKIYLVVESFAVDVFNVTRLFCVGIHQSYRSRFIIIRSDMHYLDAKALINGEEFSLRTIDLLFGFCAFFSPLQIFSCHEIRKADN